MFGLVKLYLERAENEIMLAEALFKISGRSSFKEELEIDKQETFYSAVISHAYYSIFYSVKAILLMKDIKTKPPNEHKKVYAEFKKLVDSGFVDTLKGTSKSLFEIYEEESVKAESLLNIFFSEKKKRGKFTYKKLPQANVEPAKESLDNCLIFFKNINAIIDKSKVKDEN